MNPSGPRYRIGVAQRTDAAAVHALRVAAYAGAAEFDWNDPATLAWSAADDEGVVLALWTPTGALLCSLRASVFGTTAQAERFLEYSLRGVPAEPPLLVLSRAATAPAQARHGLLALLRHAYLSVLPGRGLGAIVAVVYEGAPRLRSMQRTGYAFHQPIAAWDSEAHARNRPLVAVLPGARFSAAAEEARGAVAEQLVAVAIDHAAIALALQRLVGRVTPSAVC
jgi:hypothetical protein